MEPTRHIIPEDHPVREVFRVLTERGMEQTKLRDAEAIRYVTNLLIEFVPIENLHSLRDVSGRPLHSLPQLLEHAGETMSAEWRHEYYRHVGDVALFNLGLFPENLTYGRRTVSPSFYAERGRYFYRVAADLETSQVAPVFRTLSDQFNECVGGLNWVKRYISDPFYQYMFRQFRIT